MAKYPNPDYGTGVLRRGIRLSNRRGEIIAELEDSIHAFRLRILHDNRRILSLLADPIRYPFDTCPSAVAQLNALVGQSLAMDAGDCRQLLDPGNNCTHLYDLALLALAQWQRGGVDRVYAASIPDEVAAGTDIELSCNGEILFQWRVKGHLIVTPGHLAGQPMMRGFYRWASTEYAGERLEAALILQRAYFVAQARRSDYLNAGGRLAVADNMPEGACYTYNSGVVEKAVHTAGMGRDFSSTPEQLLKFL